MYEAFEYATWVNCKHFNSCMKMDLIQIRLEVTNVRKKRFFLSFLMYMLSKSKIHSVTKAHFG